MQTFMGLFVERSSSMTLFRRKNAFQEHHDEVMEVNVVHFLYRPADWTLRRQTTLISNEWE